MQYIDWICDFEVVSKLGIIFEWFVFCWQSNFEMYEFYFEGYQCLFFDGMMYYYCVVDLFDVIELWDYLWLLMLVFQFYGLKDMVVYYDGLCDIWNWIDSDYMLVMLFGIGYNVQNEVVEMVFQIFCFWFDVCCD